MIVARGLHGVCRGCRTGEACAACWRVISRTLESNDGLTAFQRACQRKSHPRAILAAWRWKVLFLEGTKKKAQLRVNDGTFLGINDGHEGLIIGTPDGGTPRNLLLDAEIVREPRVL